MGEIKKPWVFAQDGEDLFIASEEDVKNWEKGDKNFPAQMYSPEDKHFSEVKPFQVWMKFMYGVELVTPYPFDTEKAAKFYSSRQRRWFFVNRAKKPPKEEKLQKPFFQALNDALISAQEKDGGL